MSVQPIPGTAPKPTMGTGNLSRTARTSRPRRQSTLPRFTLSEFTGKTGNARRWRYQAGERVTILGPTGWGKTHLAYELLDASASLRLPALALVIKPRDATALRFARELDMPRVQSYPLPPNPLRRKRRGYTIWPSHRFDESDDARLFQVVSRVLAHSYRRGNYIVFADETAGLIDLEVPRHLPKTTPTVERRLKTLYSRGRSMGAGVWSCSQRPVDIPLLAYSMADHLVLGNDPDARGRKRYDEIGGVDAGLVAHETSLLSKYHWLYIRRDGQRMCIITPG